MEIDLGAVHANIGDRAAGRNDPLAEHEGGRDAHGLDRGIHAAAVGQLHHGGGGIAGGAVDHIGGAEAPRDLEPVAVEIDDDQLRRGVELGRQQRGQADRAGADDGDRAAGLNLAVEHAALEAGRQDIAQHDERFLVRAVGDRI